MLSHSTLKEAINSLKEETMKLKTSLLDFSNSRSNVVNILSDEPLQACPSDRMKQVSFRVGDNINNAIKQLDRFGITNLSKFFRDALYDFMHDYKNNNIPPNEYEQRFYNHEEDLLADKYTVCISSEVYKELQKLYRTYPERKDFFNLSCFIRCAIIRSFEIRGLNIRNNIGGRNV